MNALLLGAANEHQLKKKTPICMKTAVIARARPWMRMLDVWCIVPGRNSAGLFGGSVAFGARVAVVVALQLQSDMHVQPRYPAQARPNSSFASKGKKVA